MARAVSAPAATHAIVERLERLPPSSWHLRARVIVGTATFFDGFDVLSMTYALPVLAVLWKLNPRQIGMILSAGFAGQLVGALASGWFAERFGRLRITTVTVAIFAVMSLLCAFARNANSMAVMRFVQGIGLGGEVPVAATYISEIARAHGRGRFFTLYELVFAFGLLCSAVLGYLIVPRFGWQAMFYLGALPAFLVVAIRQVLPESPRWLASKGRFDEADAIVSRIEQSIVRDGTSLPPPSAAPTVRESPLATRWRELFEGIYLRRTLVVWVLWFSCYTITYGLLTWLPTVFRTVFHLSLGTSLAYGLIIQSVGFAGSTICAFSIDHVGRRQWFVGAFLGGGASLCALWWLDAANASTLVVCASASFFFISSISLTLYLYTAELYPTRMRALGTGVASAWLRLASAVGPSVVGFMLATRGIRSVFVLFGSVALLGAVVTALGAKETNGRLLEAISP